MKYIISLLLSLTFLTVILFKDLPTLYFFSDDFVWLLTAKRDAVVDLPSYFIQSNGFFYRPITKLYFWGMWQLVADTAFWYHIVNLVFHLLTSICVYLLSLRLLSRLRISSRKYVPPLIGFGTSLLYFVHPAHLENIVWPSAITELIPAACVLASLYIFTHYLDSRKKIHLVLVSLLFVMGLGAHEYVVIFMLLALSVQIFWILTENSTKATSVGAVFKRLSAFGLFYGLVALITFFYLVVRAAAGSHWSGGDYSYNLMRLPYNILGNSVGYLGLMLVGIPFIDWYLQARFFFRQNLVIASIFTVLGLVLTVFVLRFLKKYLTSKLIVLSIWCLVFFAVSMAPFLALGGLAERYLYLSSYSLLLLCSTFIYVLSAWIERYTDAVADFTSYILLSGVLFLFFAFSIISDQHDWVLASKYVASRMVEFQEKCETFKDGELLVRNSPPNRIGRAWVFQVGYEEGANVYCDKNLRILRK